MTVRKQIGWTCALLVAGTVAMGAFANYEMAQMKSSLESLARDSMSSIYAAGKMDGLLKTMRGQMLMHVAQDNEAAMRSIEALVQTRKEELQQEIAGYQKTTTNDVDRAIIARAVNASERWTSLWEHKIFPLSRQMQTKEALAVINSEGVQLFKESNDAFEALVNVNKKNGDTTAASAIASANSAVWWSMVMLGACILVGATIGTYLSRSLAKTLGRISREVLDCAGQVAAGASQVASSSQTLAQGASEQAASLEETSASTEEITAMTRQNTDKTAKAAELVRVVDQQIVGANHTLDQMVHSMNEINASSDKVSKIIRVIDEIAFQTNILALNAAVEAARAGEAGMGFAVVAEEVRNLAQRSAQAAKDTAALIEESLQNSGQGKAKLTEVQSAIQLITKSAAGVKELVEEVNLGSGEQTHGMEQIAKAVMQMEQVTQNSAATAEESASSSEELNAMAETMKRSAHHLQELVGA